MADLGLRFMWFGGRSSRRDNNDSGPLGLILVDPRVRAADPRPVRRAAHAVRDEPPPRAARRRVRRAAHPLPARADLGAREAAGRPGGRPPRRPAPPRRCGSSSRSTVARRRRGRRVRGSTARSTPIRRSTSGSRHSRRCEPRARGSSAVTRASLVLARRVRRRRRRQGRERSRRRPRRRPRRRRRLAGRAAHRPARPERRRADPPGAERQDREHAAGAAADRARGRRHRVGRGRRGSDHPLRSRCSSRSSHRRRRPGPLGAADRPAIVWPVGGIFAYSGGAPYAIDGINAAPVMLIDENTAGAAMFRDTSRARAAQPLRPPRPAVGVRRHAGPAAAAVPVPQGRASRGRRARRRVGRRSGSRDYAVGYTWDAAIGTWMRSIDRRPFTSRTGGADRDRRTS